MLPSKPKSLATSFYRLCSINEDEKKNVDFIRFDAKRDEENDPTTDRNIKHVLSPFISTSQEPTIFTQFFDYITAETNLSMFLSKESISAFQTIGQILSKFDSEHKIINVFAKYPTTDVIISIIALSKLQKAASLYQQSNKSDVAPQDRQAHHDFCDKNRELVNDLAHYSIFASAAYGWKSQLALSGKLHFGDDNLLIERTGILRCDIVATNWKSKTHCPAYFIARDTERQNLVLCIRGTLSPRDVLTDLCCNAEEFECCHGMGGVPMLTRAHKGMILAAKSISNLTQNTIKDELQRNPNFNLVIVGHSLGAGAASILASLWKNTLTNRRILVYAFGCPCVGPENTTDEDVISIVDEGDPFCRLSLGHLADLSIVLSHLSTNATLCSEILNRTQNKNDKKTLEWCHETLEKLSQDFMTAEKFYPPGRILTIESSGLALSEVPRRNFRKILLHTRMLDLSRHTPNWYERNLNKLWHEVDHSNDSS